jgi:hypothetical protein
MLFGYVQGKLCDEGAVTKLYSTKVVMSTRSYVQISNEAFTVFLLSLYRKNEEGFDDDK